jgi:hypothetical protein
MPHDLKIGASITAYINFDPSGIGQREAIFEWSDSVGKIFFRAVLTGTGGQNAFSTSLSCDTVAASVGDTIHYVVRMSNQLDDAHVIAFHCRLDFDTTMLFPLGVRSDSGIIGRTFAVHGNRVASRHAALHYEVTATSTQELAGDGAIFVVDFLVLLGDALQTAINVSDASYADVNRDTNFVTTAYHPGAVLVNVCGDSTQLVSSSPRSLMLSSVAPNPITTDADVSYWLPAIGPVTLALFDIQGREVVILTRGDHTAGQYSAHLDAHAIPAGRYFLSLQAGRFREIHALNIVH